ncbi:hypothetical protein ACFV29_39475 [Streptomyces sp. NPDC059690]|uniref:hypothetical protein n=1 Tax=Streptomyces sp. NPDC059690 TaxID=3346907 RepID=UPI0036B2468A
MPGPDFAQRISLLLTAAATRADTPSSLPARSETSYRPFPDIPPQSRSLSPDEVQRQVGEMATR